MIPSWNFDSISSCEKTFGNILSENQVKGDLTTRGDQFCDTKIYFTKTISATIQFSFQRLFPFQHYKNLWFPK